MGERRQAQQARRGEASADCAVRALAGVIGHAETAALTAAIATGHDLSGLLAIGLGALNRKHAHDLKALPSTTSRPRHRWCHRCSRSQSRPPLRMPSQRGQTKKSPSRRASPRGIRSLLTRAPRDRELLLRCARGARILKKKWNDEGATQGFLLPLTSSTCHSLSRPQHLTDAQVCAHRLCS